MWSQMSINSPALKEGVEAAGGIGEDQGFDAQGRHQPHRKGHLGQGIAFVGMDPAMAHRTGFPASRPQQRRPRWLGLVARGKWGSSA